MTIDNSLEWVRKDFPSLQIKHDGRLPVYFDNACNTLVPRQVVEAFCEYYNEFPACGEGRSRHRFASEVTDRIDGNPDRDMKGSRHMVKDFLNASSHKEIIFTLNSSHGINLVALGTQFKPGDVVLHTDKEHNSNLIPWLRLRKKGIIMNQPIDSTPEGEIDLDMFEQQLKTRKVRLVSLGFTSNLTGYTVPAKEMIQLAHRYGALVLLDGAQAVPHQKIDVKDLDVDFLAFSMHKMCGPRGVGVLYGKSDYLGKMTREEDEAENVILPVMLGGDTVFDSNYDDYTLLQPPERFEVGLQDYAGQIATGAAVEYLQKVGMDTIKKQEEKLNSYLTGKLMERYGDLGWFHILGPKDPLKRSGILSFEVKRPNANGIAEELSDKSNVMIRDGQFCVHSYLNKTFGVGWSGPQLPNEQRMMYRVSFYFYNTIEECDVFLETLQEIFEERFYV